MAEQLPNFYDELFLKMVIENGADSELAQLQSPMERAIVEANRIINERKPNYYNLYRGDLDERLEACETEDEKLLLINAELDQVQEWVERSKNAVSAQERAWFDGYRAEARKKPLLVTSPFEPGIMEAICHGAAHCRIEVELKEMQTGLKASLNKSPYFEGFQQAESAIFFKFSGIYDLLVEKLQTSRKASKLVAELSGHIGKGESLRSHLSVSGKYDKEHKESKDLFKPHSVDRAMRALEDFGFDTTALRKIQIQVENDNAARPVKRAKRKKE